MSRGITLIGWSWGTTTTAAYAAQNPDKVRHAGPGFARVAGCAATAVSRRVSHQHARSARAFAISGIPRGSGRGDRAARPSFDAWWAATLATDPEGARQSPPVVRSPNGVLQDFEELWAAGKPNYDPAKILAPTLLLVGEWDVVTPPAMAQGLFTQLSNARERRLIQFSEATHFLIIEKHRMRLMREVQNFLDER